MAFMIVVIAIGVPMWWKTTEVYRVPLPNADILGLSNQPIRITVRIGIFTFDEKRGKLLVAELQQAFQDSELWRLQLEAIAPFESAGHAMTPTALEALIGKRYALKEGDFVFIEWPKLQEQVLMTTERSGLIRHDTSAAKLKSVITILLLQTHRIQQILSNNQRYAKHSVAPQPQYDVVVSVLNPRPDILMAKWNVQMAVGTYIAPFLREVSHISNYTLKTQWRYQLPFEVELSQVRDESPLGRHYGLPESALPHIITAIERNLGVGISARSAINLVVYLPPCDISPVHIYNRHNKLATRNNVDSFISPKWGAIIIANPPASACRGPYNEQSENEEFFVNTNDVMQVMLHQLYKLLDIPVEHYIEGVTSVDIEQIGPRRWEYEAYIRRSVVTHIQTATNTLQSLIKLLDNISYIVINDAVGADIIESYTNIVRAKTALSDASHLLDAVKYARRAFVTSEQAFFDVSLLAQLYFPDEQKYAIYIPLFLPIMVPVITSFSMIRKSWRKLFPLAYEVKTN